MDVTYCLQSVDMLIPCCNSECSKYAKDLEPKPNVTYRWMKPAKCEGNTCPSFEKKK